MRDSGLRDDPDLEAELLPRPRRGTRCARRRVRGGWRGRWPGTRAGRRPGGGYRRSLLRLQWLDFLRVHPTGDAVGAVCLAGGDAGRLRRGLAHPPAAGVRAGAGGDRAEQAGPRGRTVLLRSTVDGEAFSTAHKSQTVYDGPVVYSDDPYRRLERATSDLELLLLPVFLKDAAHRAQREYRFVVWAEEEPREDRLDLPVSLALLDAMQAPLQDSEGAGFVPAGVEESSTIEAINDDGHPRAALHVEALPAFVTSGNPTVAPRRYDVEALPSDLREMAPIHAGVEALRSAVAKSDASCRKEAAAAAWHAEPILRFLCSTFGDGIAGAGVNEDGFILITAELTGDTWVEASIAVGPEGTFAGRISAGKAHLASTAGDADSFEQALKQRLGEVGVRVRGPDS